MNRYFKENNIKVKLILLIKDIANELELKQCIVKSNTGILVKKDSFIPNEKCTDMIVEKLRAELLEEGNITEEVIALASLLEKSNLLKKYFSSHESKKLKARVKEIRNTSENKLVKEMIEYVDIFFSDLIFI